MFDPIRDANIRILMQTGKNNSGTPISLIAIILFSIIFGGERMVAFSQTVYNVREVKGVVIDSISEEKLPLVNIYALGSGAGCLSAEDGSFILRSHLPFSQLRVSSMGYDPQIISLNPEYINNLIVRLKPSSTTLAEVTVKSGKQKYSRKNNPAVELMEKIRKNYPKHDPRDSTFYSYDLYEKMVVGLSDFQMPDSGSFSAKKMPFLRDYIDTVPYASKPILKVSVKEKAASKIYSQNDAKGKEIVVGQTTAGIDKSFNQANIQAALEDTFREINIFGNDITILQNRFVSPLAAIGANYYKYFLDTISEGNHKLLELSFAPHNPESMGFNGKLWVELGDTTYFVQRVQMRVPHAINLNFVKNLFIDQTFTRDEAGNRHSLSDDITVLFQLLPGTQGIYGRRQTLYKNHSFKPRTDLTEYYSVGGDKFFLADSEEKDENFWRQARPFELPKSEREMGSLIHKLRKVPFFYWAEKILVILVNGYISTGKDSKFDVGPVNTFISSNKAEGLRLRLGGITTANLSKYLFARGYVAYGFKDKKGKYGGELEWSFNPKKYNSREFPIHSIRGEYQYDTDRLGEHYLFTNPDNIFLSIKRKGSYLITYRRLAKLTYIHEFPFNFSINAGLRFERQESTEWVPFQFADGKRNSYFNQTAFFISLRYAPGEKFVQQPTTRLPLNMDAPVFQLTHEFGPKGFIGANFTLNKTEFSFQKRFWFSAFGYLNTIIKYGKIWSTVYYPALLWQNANLSYTIQPESYALLNPMEFALDQYGSIDLTYFGNGILFNRIPLIKKLKVREILAFRGFLGHLSKRNNADYNKSIYIFPADANVGLMNKTPYMEASVGIDNIASILRVDYVWRLTYRDRPWIDRSGLRISLHFSF